MNDWGISVKLMEDWKMPYVSVIAGACGVFLLTPFPLMIALFIVAHQEWIPVVTDFVVLLFVAYVFLKMTRLMFK